MCITIVGITHAQHDRGSKFKLKDYRGTATNRFSFCSYAELYDTTGHIQKTLGNPLVYKDVLLKTKDSTIFFTLYFFSLNKEFKTIDVKNQ